jgi:uncharacterized protein YndB with AHSA1/START domain
MEKIYFEKIFKAPRKAVFDHLSDHKNLSPIFNARITRIRDGKDGNVNGKGSVREICLVPGIKFEETITGFVPDTMIEYVISKGSPLKNHKGTMEFSDHGTGTCLRYRIEFESKYPIPFFGSIVRWGLERTIISGFNKYARTQ